MGKKAKTRQLSRQPQAGVEGSFSPLWWIAIVLAFTSLVISLFPWVAPPEWLLEIQDLTSDQTLDLDLAVAYNPMGYADLATALHGAFSQGIVVWILGGAESIWVAALTFIVLAIGGTIYKRPFDREQLRRFLYWGLGAMVIAVFLTILFAGMSGDLLQASFDPIPQGLDGYLAYVGGVDIVSHGFLVTPWLWISFGCAAAALVCGVSSLAIERRNATS